MNERIVMLVGIALVIILLGGLIVYFLPFPQELKILGFILGGLASLAIAVVAFSGGGATVSSIGKAVTKIAEATVKDELGEGWTFIPEDKQIYIIDNRRKETYRARAYKILKAEGLLKTVLILDDDGKVRRYEDIVLLANNPFSIWETGEYIQSWIVEDNPIQTYEKLLALTKLQKRKLLKELQEATKTFEEAYASKNKLSKELRMFGSYGDRESIFGTLLEEGETE